MPHPYYGISYDKNFICSLVQQSGFHYDLYIHDPKNPKFTTPSQFFGDVANLIKSGKRVGWFQGRWGVNSTIDFNRCILSKEMLNDIHIDYPHFDCKVHLQCSHLNLINRLIKTIGHYPYIYNLNAYNPQEAIAKLKNKEIDVLVIANIIVARKKEDLE